MKIGSKIKEARENKKLTQLELSEKLGISRNYISDLENDRNTPSVKTLARISIELDMDLNILIGNDGNTIQK